MNYSEIYEKLYAIKNQEAAIPMASYMKNMFSFLGVKTPERKAICRAYFKEAKKENVVDWDFINCCWKNEYRELQYVAIDYLDIVQTKLIPADVERIKVLAQSKSWWDTIDGLDKVVGTIALSYPTVNETILAWSVDEDFWLRRIAIDHQLTRKDKTNNQLLERVIINNLGQKEFFINKAIGWSLREYSKTNPEWVRQFIEKNKAEMASLSIKEASKYL